MKTYNVKAVIEVLPNGKTDVLYEAAPEVFVELDEFLAMKKERGEQAVKEVKKISKKEKVKAFLAKLIEKKRRKKPFTERYQEAVKQAKIKEEAHTGAGSEYLREWELKHEEELLKYEAEKLSEKQSQLKFIHPSYSFAFGEELGGLTGADGLAGFAEVYVAKHKKRFTDLSMSAREKIAKEVLKTLFPTATRFDALVISAFTKPLQTDGGIDMTLSGKTVKGKLRYDKIYKPSTDYLSKATKIVLK